MAPLISIMDPGQTWDTVEVFRRRNGHQGSLLVYLKQGGKLGVLSSNRSWQYINCRIYFYFLLKTPIFINYEAGDTMLEAGSRYV